jgi:membrane-bound inhibitor of C-type lysozyme
MHKIRFIKPAFLLITAMIWMLASCNHKKNNSPVLQEVKTTVLNMKGDSLIMSYNNSAGTLKLVFNDDTLHLSRDTTASGIQYSNGAYLYTEWQGEITLKKGKDVVFTNKK